MVNRTLLPSTLALLLSFASIASLAQSPPIHGLAHVAYRVKDVSASRSFYQKLGYGEAFAFEKDGVITQSFLKVNDRQFIELYPAAAPQPLAPQPLDPQPLGFMHLCFDGDDLQALHDYDAAHGLKPTEVRKAGAGNLLFTVAGPDEGPVSQNIEYTQYMPGSRHYEDRGKHLGADRISTKFFAVALGMSYPAEARISYITTLDFAPVPRQPQLLSIPGAAGQQILLTDAAIKRGGTLFFPVTNLKLTAAELNQRGIAFTTQKTALTVTDPDGNLLIFTTDSNAHL